MREDAGKAQFALPLQGGRLAWRPRLLGPLPASNHPWIN